jgi:hypothetical protein
VLIGGGGLNPDQPAITLAYPPLPILPTGDGVRLTHALDIRLAHS